METPEPGVAGTSDAAGALERARRRLAESVAGGGVSLRPDVQVIAVGIGTIRRRLVALGERSHELLSVRTHASADGVLANHKANVELRGRGLSMASLFDYHSIDDETRRLVGTLHGTPYHFCVAPVQLKIIDRRVVVLHGPRVDGEQTAIAVTTPAVVQLAMCYWRCIQESAVPASSLVPSHSRLGLSARQWHVARFLAEELTDHHIADRMGISLRTVRTEVAAILKMTGARTRFGAGVRLGQLGLLAGPELLPESAPTRRSQA